MAKSKKGKKKPAARRVGGGLNMNSPLVFWGSVAGGFFLAGKINPMIDKVAGNLDPKIIGGAQAGLGALILLKKGKKSPLLVIPAGVVAGAGVKRLLSSFGLGNVSIRGYQDIRAVSGYQDVRAVSGGSGRRMNASAYASRNGINGVSGSGLMAGSGSGCMQ